MTANPVSQEPSQKEFLKLALPNMMAAMAIPITELVDLAYLGHLDDVSQLSGVVLAGVIFSYLYWCFSFLRIGTTGLTAQAVGRGDKPEQEALFWRPVLLGTLIGCALLLFQIPLGNIGFAFLSGEPEVEAAGRSYFNMLIWGAPILMATMPMSGWLLGHGRSVLVWMMHLVWQVSNIILNYIFVIEYDMGAMGAGLGSMIAEWIVGLFSIGAVLYYWKEVPAFNRKRVFDWHNYKYLLTLNSAIMLRTFLLMSVLAAFTNISATFGTVMLAANALMMKLFSFYAFICDGYATALEILAGKSHGRGNKAELRRSFRLSMQWTMGTGAVFIALYAVATAPILSLLTEHENIVQAALPYVGWMCVTIMVGGVSFVYDGLFYGLAKPKTLALSMLASVSIFIPLAYYAWHIQSTTWLWIAFFTFTTARMAVLTYPTVKALR